MAFDRRQTCRLLIRGVANTHAKVFMRSELRAQDARCKGTISTYTFPLHLVLGSSSNTGTFMLEMQFLQAFQMPW